MSLIEVAGETIVIVEQGAYGTRSGLRVELKPEIERAIARTRTYIPEELASLLQARQLKTGNPGLPEIEITPESTAQAARRLYQTEGERNVVSLNFASAKNPGGGFLKGAKSQEEDLARCSALYHCLLPQRQYYEANRAFRSTLYTDYLIYSPRVPFFRDDNLELLDKPFFTSIITSPAPNAGEFLRQEPGRSSELYPTLERRAGMVLSVAAEEGHRVLVLGAWGCGIFQNDPAEVATVFASWLKHPGFAGAFDRVIFGIYETDRNHPTLEIFKKKLLA